MIELTYIEHNEEFAKDLSTKKYFKTWKSLDKFVMSQKLEKYKVEGQSPGGNIIQYTSVLWEDFKAKHFHRYRDNE
jgi:hypothetical protein